MRRPVPLGDHHERNRDESVAGFRSRNCEPSYRNGLRLPNRQNAVRLPLLGLSAAKPKPRALNNHNTMIHTMIHFIIAPCTLSSA